jgi:hypothetical protein
VSRVLPRLRRGTQHFDDLDCCHGVRVNLRGAPD